MEHHARLAGTASLLAMDANFNLGVVEGYPTALLVALARGDLVNLDQLHPLATGTVCASGFCWGEVPITRIDGVLAEVGTAGRLTRVGVARSGTNLALEQAGQQVLKPVLLDPFEVQARDLQLVEAIVAGLLGPHVEQWRLVLQGGDVNELWGRWTWLA